MQQYQMLELRLNGPEPEGSQTSVDIRAVFEVQERKTEVKGFYAGNGTYVVRFYPEEAGHYHYQITGVVEACGDLDCLPAGAICRQEKPESKQEEPEGQESKQGNPENKQEEQESRQEGQLQSADLGGHGMVRAEGTHFRYADGTWFYPFGTTVYAFSHQEDERVEETFETLKNAPFNKIRMCVFPKHYVYNENEPALFAFEKTDDGWDVHKPCFAFWDRLESHIARLDGMGIQCDLILFHPYDHWGFSRLSREEALVYLDYVTRRLSAFPNVWWSLANEYDLMEYEMGDWECFAHFLHEQDVYGHLLSNHQIVHPWDFTNPDTTHICLQTGELEDISGQIQHYGKPLLVDECGYEGNIPFNWGNLSAFELVDRFWTVCMQGGYCSHGETYLNEEEVLWWSKGGRLAGESPARIGFLRSILESLPGPLDFTGRSMGRKEFEQMKAAITEEQQKDPIVRLLVRSPWEEAKRILDSSKELAGNCGEDAYLKYYARHCTSEGSLDLPENGTYDVEVIDVWEMTSTQALHGVNGRVKMTLPGKEGIAVLARKTAML